MIRPSKQYDIPSENLCFISKNFVATGLPMRKFAGNEFVRQNNLVTTHMVSLQDIGLPYGMVARWIIISIVTYMVRTRKQIMYIGNSNREHFEYLGVKQTTSGRATKERNEQIKRVLNCGFHIDKQTKDGLQTESNRFYISKQERIDDVKDIKEIVISDDFYNYVIVKKQIFPLDRKVLRLLSKSQSPVIFDLYIFLCYQQKYMRNTGRSQMHIPIESLVAQFGMQFKRPFDFKRRIENGVKCVQTFLQADIDIDTKGLVMTLDSVNKSVN